MSNGAVIAAACLMVLTEAGYSAAEIASLLDARAASGPAPEGTTGILGAMGVCAAYAHKLKTGEGQMVDTSLFEAGITLTYWHSAIALAGGVSPGPMGSAHPLSAPYQAFATKDGWINEHPLAGPVKTVGLPVKFSATPGAVLDPAPVFGEHTREVMVGTMSRASV
jgi:crotonobetainyl-CoA:carnitine CoA-transferase CaiB-like acyl-CoA transferase